MMHSAGWAPAGLQGRKERVWGSGQLSLCLSLNGMKPSLALPNAAITNASSKHADRRLWPPTLELQKERNSHTNSVRSYETPPHSSLP